jgi:hypothetical protein
MNSDGCNYIQYRAAGKPSLWFFGHELTRIFHQDTEFWVVPGEPGRARPAQPIDPSIGKTGMPEMAGIIEKAFAHAHLQAIRGWPGEISGLRPVGLFCGYRMECETQNPFTTENTN